MIMRSTLESQDYGMYTCYAVGPHSESDARILLRRTYSIVFYIIFCPNFKSCLDIFLGLTRSEKCRNLNMLNIMIKAYITLVYIGFLLHNHSETHSAPYNGCQQWGIFKHCKLNCRKITFYYQIDGPQLVSIHSWYQFSIICHLSPDGHFLIFMILVPPLN